MLTDSFDAAQSPRIRAVKEAVATWSKQLIDLSGRNRLLFYRDLKTGTMDLTPIQAASPERFEELMAGNAVLLTQLVAPSQLQLSEPRDNGLEPSSGHTVEDVERVAKRARALSAKAKENYEEKGLRTLQLGWGLASWESDRSDSAPAAPVVLCPVSLDPVGTAGRDYSIKLQGEWSVNDALLHVLHVDFDVTLSRGALDAALEDLAMSRQPARVFALMREAYSNVPGFSLSERLVLANFSYAKLPIATDLESSVDKLIGHDVVAAIAGDEDAKSLLRERLAAVADVTADVPPEDEYLVLDADSSQSVAINAVVRGAHTVIQGPPGTGKSQTIANLIATLVARHKTVLFVAEKRAAIDAVLRRLEGVGLENLVLDLHDGTSNRKRIAQGLADALDHASRTPLEDVSEQQRRLAKRREELDRYVAALHCERAPWGVSVYAAQSEVMGTPPQLRSSRRIRGSRLEKLDAQAMNDCMEAVREYTARGGPRLVGSESPWAYALLNQKIPTPRKAELTLDLLERLHDQGLPRLASAVEAALPIVGHAGSGCISDWARVPQLLETMSVTTQRFSTVLLDAELDALLADLQRGAQAGFGGLVTRVRDTRFRRARKRARSMCLQRPHDLSDLIQWLQEARDCLENWRSILPEADPARQHEIGVNLGAALASVNADIESLTAIIGADVAQLACDEALDMVSALLRDREWLYRLPTLIAARRTLKEHGLDDLLADIDAAVEDSAANAVTTVRYVWLMSIVEAVHITDPVLGSFDSRAQQAVVDEYRELDAQHIRLTAARVRRACAECLMTARDCHPDESELVVQQAMRKRRHLPMREFLPRAANVLAALKPCWAMSPLVVSQVLPNETLFDVVIFDEASQVPPWEAVPSILRGRTVVVAGDRKQLPPTTFFMAADDGALEEEVEDDTQLMTEDLESVLDVMSTILPAPIGTRTLNWHYRSRDERLIAFSNASFYAHGLTTFPGVDSDTCIHHHLMAPTANSLGEGGSTAEEVARVVELVFEHARTRPNESLGVIAMGIKHADRISEAVRLRRRDELDCEGFFAGHPEEPFFVKNLERVQGDERDAIILTVGYGRTSDGRMRYMFGPLNNDGGERRLNVAVTRARRRMDVVSSFSASEMDPDRLKKEGARLLRDYLEYAESGGVSLPGRVVSRPALNAFERDVGERLEQAGIRVVPQYGVSGYYIDFVARHPSLPGKMVLAIECDGDKYHRSPSARERDRLRQEHLERLGWRFVRVWSSDWARNPEQQTARILRAYERAIEDAAYPDPTVDSPQIPRAPAVDVPSSPSASVVERRAPRPPVPRGRTIDAYSKGDLIALLEWIQSDTLLRTRDEMVSLLMKELGFKRRGKHVIAACERAIDAYLARADPARFSRTREARVDALSAMGVDVRFDTKIGWRYRIGHREVGPLSWQELWQAARRGEVGPTTEVWHKAHGRWRPASEFPGLFT